MSSHKKDSLPVSGGWKRRWALSELARYDRETLVAALSAQPAPLSPAWLQQRKLRWLMAALDAGDVFGLVYEKNIWGSAESRSGAGSTMAETEALRATLPPLLRSLGARSLLDIPCGDFHWMSTVDLPGMTYIGADIVPALVEANNAAFASASRRFECLDLMRDSLPIADAVMCRDCLVHLPNGMAAAALRNLCASGAKWLLATTFPSVATNEDIPLGHWRPVNLQLPPFSLPAPVRLLHEGNPDARYEDKSLGVWEVREVVGTVA